MGAGGVTVRQGSCCVLWEDAALIKAVNVCVSGSATHGTSLALRCHVGAGG